MDIIIGCDHGAFKVKEELKRHLSDNGHAVEDVGTGSDLSVDYPEYAAKLAKRVQETGNTGILLCGTGIGMSMAANKFKGIRAALCHDVHTAKMAREHNNANVLCLGGRTTSLEDVKKIVDVFLTTETSQEERHHRRVDEISSIEKDNFK
ncbi:ribose 5-phosphate isomerase B [Candidatus Woesearchaeota archaeon]|nr:ribose 5-phosphate isomerase B [Candidatus Woesearchaeota archaeon]